MVDPSHLKRGSFEKEVVVFCKSLFFYNMWLGKLVSDLLSTRVVHESLSWIRTDPTRRNVDPTRPAIATKLRTGPLPHYVLCFKSSTFKLPTGNNIQLLHDLFRSCNVSEGEKIDLDWSYFLDRGLEATKRLHILDVIVKCIQGLI